MVKSHDIRDRVISYDKNEGNLQHYWQIKCIEVQLIVGYIVTNNLIKSKSERSRTVVQRKTVFILLKKKT